MDANKDGPRPRPTTTTSHPTDSKPQPEVANLQLGALNSQPAHANLQPCPSNLQPWSVNTPSGPANTQPDTTNFQPGISNILPTFSIFQFGAANLQPGPLNLHPGPPNLQPGDIGYPVWVPRLFHGHHVPHLDHGHPYPYNNRPAATSTRPAEAIINWDVSSQSSATGSQPGTPRLHPLQIAEPVVDWNDTSSQSAAANSQPDTSRLLRSHTGNAIVIPWNDISSQSSVVQSQSSTPSRHHMGVWSPRVWERIFSRTGTDSVHPNDQTTSSPRQRREEAALATPLHARLPPTRVWSDNREEFETVTSLPEPPLLDTATRSGEGKKYPEESLDRDRRGAISIPKPMPPIPTFDRASGGWRAPPGFVNPPGFGQPADGIDRGEGILKETWKPENWQSNPSRFVTDESVPSDWAYDYRGKHTAYLDKLVPAGSYFSSQRKPPGGIAVSIPTAASPSVIEAKAEAEIKARADVQAQSAAPGSFSKSRPKRFSPEPPDPDYLAEQELEMTAKREYLKMMAEKHGVNEPSGADSGFPGLVRRPKRKVQHSGPNDDEAISPTENPHKRPKIQTTDFADSVERGDYTDFAQSVGVEREDTANSEAVSPKTNPWSRPNKPQNQDPNRKDSGPGGSLRGGDVYLRGGGSSTTTPQQSGGLFGSSTTANQPAQSSGGGGLFSFNQTSQPQQSGGGTFGSGAATSQAQQSGGGLFGGGAATSQPQQPSGGLFGNSAATSQAQPSGSLFGRISGGPATQPQTGGLFGGSTATTSAQQTSGLFGAALASSQPASGGLFGSTSTSKPAGSLFGNTTATASSTGGGLFGNTATTSAPAASVGGGLFGGALGATKPAGGLFGNTTTTATPAASTGGGGLFGSAPAAQPSTSGGLFGSLNQASQSQQQQQQTVPAVRVDASNIKPTTRFSELHDEVQQLILAIDDIVQSSITRSMQCGQAIPQLGQAIEQLPRDVEYLDSKIETVEGALSRDATAVGQTKDIVHDDAKDALRVFRAVENLKLPPQFHYSSIGGGFSNNATSADEEFGSTDLLPYFQQNTTALASALDKYESNILEVEQHLRTVEGSAIESMEKIVRRRQATNGGGGAGALDPRKEGLRELAGAMRGFEDAVLRVAGRVGEAREGVVELSLGSGMGGGRR